MVGSQSQGRKYPTRACEAITLIAVIADTRPGPATALRRHIVARGVLTAATIVIGTSITYVAN